MKEAAIGMGATTTQTVLDGAVADGNARHPDRRHAGHRPRRRRDRAAALHRPIQQLLAMAHGTFEFMQPTASLAVLIYNFAGMPFKNQVELAWAAALVLVLLVLVDQPHRPKPIKPSDSTMGGEMMATTMQHPTRRYRGAKNKTQR